ncbi:MAG: PAS domain-containing protein [Thermomicrobiales bacterium]
MAAGSNHLKLSSAEIRSLFTDADTSPHLRMDVFDLAAVAMGIITPFGTWLRANPAMSALFGHPAEEFLNFQTNALIHPDDVARAESERRKLIDREQDHLRLEVRCLHGSGEVIWTRQHLTAVRLPEREATYLLVQIEDISELKASEALRRQKDDYLRTLVGHLPGVVVASFDRDLRLQMIEGQGLEHHGLSNEDLQGRTPYEIAGPVHGPEIVAHFKAALAGRSRTFESMHGERYYETRVIPMPDENGEISSGLAVYIDITDLKRAEISRQRRGDIYRAIVRNLPGAIAAVFDRDLRYLVVDGHGLADLGVTPEMVEGKTVWEFWEPGRRESVARHLQAALDGEPQEYESTIQGRDYEVRAIPIPDADGTINIGVVVNFDITERKNYEREMTAVSEALARSNRELEQFAFVASHDLRAPLISLQGLATILEDEHYEKLDVQGRYLLSRIIANADQMQKLLIELLEISRVGRADMDFIPVDLEDVVQHVRDQHEFTLRRRNAEVESNLDGVTVYANWTRMVQLFSNLIDNALKYTPVDRAPRIDISASDGGDYWVVAVADNGVGIPEDHRDDVFNMFHRLRSGKDLNPGGAGMGLALVEQIVKVHGGDIWVAPGRAEGTAICFTFPKDEQEEEGEKL